MARAFKKIFAVAGGATAAAVVVTYTDQLYKMNRQIDEADMLTLEQIHKAYAEFQKMENNNSLLKRNLTPGILKKLESRKTKLGASLLDIIRSGCNVTSTEVGLLAPDTESYKKFAPLFDRVIEDYHGFKPGHKQPQVDLGDSRIHEFPPLDSNDQYIKSIKICCVRSIAGYPFSPLLSWDDYLILERKIRNALSEVEESGLKGVYLPLEGMSERMRSELKMSHVLFENDKPNACNFWPVGRGVFRNKDNTLVVWVNHQEHMAIVSKQNGSNLGAALDRLNSCLKALEGKLRFAYDDHLGYLASCPSNLGAAVHASVEIRLPKLMKKANFLEICENLGLGVSAVADDPQYALIFNKRSLGLSQYQAVKEMYDGVKELIRLEKSS